MLSCLTVTYTEADYSEVINWLFNVRRGGGQECGKDTTGRRKGSAAVSVGGAGQSGSGHRSMKCRIINEIDWHEGEG